MGTGGAEQRPASSLPSSSDSGSLGSNHEGRRRRKEAAAGGANGGRRRSSKGLAGAAGYFLAVLVGMSGTSEVPMSAMAATRQRQHPVAAIARNLFHPSSRERRYTED